MIGMLDAEVPMIPSVLGVLINNCFLVRPAGEPAAKDNKGFKEGLFLGKAERRHYNREVTI